MKYLMAIFLLVSTVSAAEIQCEALKNMGRVWNKSIDVYEDERLKIGEVGHFQVFVKSLAKYRYEIEVLDSKTPARYYSEGTLVDSSQIVRWTIWSREILLEVNCQTR